MLQTTNLVYSYDGKTTLHFPDVNCAKGEQWLLLGQSGSGKTTLLHLLAGLMRPNQGSVQIAGTDLSTLSNTKLDHFRGKHIGIVFQRSHFIKSLNVEDNLLVAQHLGGVKPSIERAHELFDRLRIAYKAHAKTDNLSQGEQQRLAIARALINKPDIILADEPTSALDDHNCEEVLSLLEEQASMEGATLLIVTHDGRLKSEFEHQILLEHQNQSNQKS